VALLAIQGPEAYAIMTSLVAQPSAQQSEQQSEQQSVRPSFQPSAQSSQLPLKNYTFREDLEIAGIHCLISASGYTGEAGFEICVTSENAVFLWERIIEAGKSFGLIPCGLGARDTLRL